METQKTILLAALFFLTYLMWQSWNETFPEQTPQQVTVEQSNNIVPGISATNTNVKSDVPVSTGSPVPNSIIQQARTHGKLITVKTDLVEYKIDTVGGDISEVNLLNYDNSIDDSTPLKLLTSDNNNLYIAPNGLTGVNGPDTQEQRAVYKTESLTYELLDKDSLKVDLILAGSNNNANITKSFIFNKNSYAVDVQYTVANNSNTDWRGNIFSVLKRKDIPGQSSSFISPSGYTGIAAYNTENKFHKISPDNLKDATQDWVTKQGWAAIIQQYFLSVWIPDSNESYKYIAKFNNDGTYSATLVGPEILVQPGQSLTKSIKFYAGPEQTDRLEKLAVGLNRTVDYGIMWPVASLIFSVMKKIYGVIGNWGWAIVLVTILIKVLFYRLSSSSYKSMAKLRVLAPKIEQLKKRYGEDREKMGKAMMELYKNEKVNPLGGCLPMLIQLPFFIALYWVIIESVELRHAPFIWWIQDLSVKDPYFILPILMGISMLGQQKLSPAPADPTQEKVMMMMPVVFTVLFVYFPAGLVLYWVVNTLTSILQQWWIMRTVDTERNEIINSKKKVKNTQNKLGVDKLNISKKAVNDSSIS